MFSIYCENSVNTQHHNFSSQKKSSHRIRFFFSSGTFCQFHRLEILPKTCSDFSTPTTNHFREVSCIVFYRKIDFHYVRRKNKIGRRRAREDEKEFWRYMTLLVSIHPCAMHTLQFLCALFFEYNTIFMYHLLPTREEEKKDLWRCWDDDNSLSCLCIMYECMMTMGMNKLTRPTTDHVEAVA